jgi:acetyl esterase/lipase
MFLFMHQLIRSLTAQSKSVSCLFLSYDLAPGRVYPRQLQQASLLLIHILNSLSIPPSNIILTGDSAGANLALALLSHISHPHPSTTVPIPKIDLKGDKIKGAVLISPWVSFSTTDESFKRNAYKDCINPPAGQQWSSAFMGSRWPHTTNADYYNQAVKAPASWWEGLMVENVFVVAGEEEVLIDGIKAWEGKFEEGLGRDKVEFRVFKGEYHDQVCDLLWWLRNFGGRGRMMLINDIGESRFADGVH